MCCWVPSAGPEISRFTFEVDNEGNLRIISGINPYASPYELKPGEIFKTPEFIFTLSEKGRGEAQS